MISAEQETALLALRERLLESADSEPEECRARLNEVMPALADPARGHLPLFLAFLHVEAWLAPDEEGDELFEATAALALGPQVASPTLAGRTKAVQALRRLTRGRVAGTDALWDDAQRLFHMAGESHEADLLWIDRARTVLRTGAWGHAARAIADWLECAHGPAVRGRLLLEQGLALFRDGDAAAADDCWTSARALLDPMGRAIALVYRAQWFARLGATEVALPLLDDAEVQFLKLRKATEADVAAANRAALIVAGDEARAELERLRRAPLARDPLFYWQISINLAVVLEALGRADEAQGLYHELAGLATVRDWERTLAGLNELHLRSVRHDGEALGRDLRASVARPEVVADPVFRLAAWRDLADWLRRQGRTDEAIDAYQRALEGVELARLELPWEFLRRRFQQARLRVFEGLHDVLLERGDWSEAWQVADRAKAQGLVDFAGPFYPGLVPEARAAFVAARADLARAYELGLGAAETEQRECALDLALGAGRRHYAPARPSPPWRDWDALQSPDTALVEYVHGGRGWGAYVVRNGAVTYHDLTRARVDEAVASWWPAQQESEGRRDVLDESAWRATTGAWHRTLVAPLRSDLAGVRRVLVVPHGALCLLPWAGLWDDERATYWGDDWPEGLAVLPGARLGTIAGRRDDRAAGDLDLIACPDGGGLAFSAIEAEWVATQLAPDAQILRGGVDEPTLSHLLPRCRWFHFAGHAKFDPRRPMASHLALDGRRRWTVWDLLAFPLPRTTVVLSACEAAASHAESAGEWLGLLRGFLAAGAGAVVASLWTVRDFACFPLMQAFYWACRTTPGNRARALRAAQIAARDLGRWARQVRGGPAASPCVGIGPRPLADWGRATLEIGRAQSLKTPRGRYASDAQLENELLEDLAALAHPRHWATFQVYGVGDSRETAP